MSTIRTILAAALLAASLSPALAADTATPAAVIKPGPRALARLCEGCAVVANVVPEKRKGKASGIGAAGGAVAGGVVGNQVGDSTGATVGGAVVGGVLGHAIEKRMKRHTVYIISVTQRDGSQRNFEQDTNPNLKAGDVVKIEGERVVKTTQSAAK
jgi:outer membrane lipoprotein SlyB